MTLAGENVGINDKITRGHEANRDSVSLMGSTDLGIFKDFNLSKE